MDWFYEWLCCNVLIHSDYTVQLCCCKMTDCCCMLSSKVGTLVAFIAHAKMRWGECYMYHHFSLLHLLVLVQCAQIYRVQRGCPLSKMPMFFIVNVFFFASQKCRLVWREAVLHGQYSIIAADWRHLFDAPSPCVCRVSLLVVWITRYSRPTLRQKCAKSWMANMNANQVMAPQLWHSNARIWFLLLLGQYSTYT